MKIIQSSLFRALCAIVIGALLVKYRDDMVTWLTISIGVLFFVSGIISCIAYFVQRRRYMAMELDGITITDSEGRPVRMTAPVFPLVGIGSVVLGLILAFRPAVFIDFGTYIFACIVLLGTLTQFVSLVSASKYGKVNLYYWIMPVLLFLLSIVALVHPMLIASAPFFFIGWTMMVYGFVEIINAFKLYRLRKMAANAPLQNAVSSGDDAES